MKICAGFFSSWFIRLLASCEANEYASRDVHTQSVAAGQTHQSTRPGLFRNLCRSFRTSGFSSSLVGKMSSNQETMVNNTKSYSPSCSNNSENRVTTVHNGSATSCHLYLLQVRRFRGNEFIQPPNVSKRRTFSRFYRPADAASLFRLYTQFDTRNVTEVVVWKFPPAPLAFGELYRLL